MCAWIVPPVAGLIEPSIAPEIVADGIGAVEYNNGQLRIYLYSDQMLLDGGQGTKTKIVSVKIVGQLCNVPAAIGQLARCLIGGGAPGVVPDPTPPGPGFPHLVR